MKWGGGGVWLGGRGGGPTVVRTSETVHHADVGHFTMIFCCLNPHVVNSGKKIHKHLQSFFCGSLLISIYYKNDPKQAFLYKT